MKKFVNSITWIGFIILLMGCNSDKNKRYEVRISAFDSSIFIEKVTYGVRNSISRVYYQDNLIEEILYDGKGTILSYQFFSLNGGWCYWSTYDSFGNLLKNKGEPCYYGEFFVKNNKKQNFYSSKDTLVMLFFAPNPPRSLSEFKNSKNKAFYKVEDIGCAHFGIYYPFDPGNYEFQFNMNFFDSNTHKYTKKDINQIITISQ